MVYLFGEKSKRNKAGFTLIEMMTSLAIIVMITAIFVSNYRSNNKRIDLTMTAQKLVSDLHAAQNNTLGLVKYGSVVPPGGWGIHLDMSASSSSQYILFADLDNPPVNEPDQITPADAGYMSYNSGEGDPGLGARVVTLPAGVVISSLVVENGVSTSSVNMANVTFLPPDPKTNVYDGSTVYSALNITLKDKRENAIKTIRVNFLGLAEVIN